MRKVPTTDLGSQLSRRQLALPADLVGPDPPADCPRGIGHELWHGKTRERDTHVHEYRLWKGDEIALRVRTTSDGALLGVHDGELRRDGSAKPMRAEYAEDGERIAQVATGRLLVKGCEPSVLGALHLLKNMGARITKRRDPIVRKARTAEKPLYLVYWESVLTAAELVWSSQGDAPGHLARTKKLEGGDRAVTAIISVEQLLRKVERGRRLPWWQDTVDAERKEVADTMRHDARSALTSPRRWKWWAGSAQRATGWVRRCDYTGCLRVVGVRSWSGDRSGILTAVQRYVRPLHEQQEMF